MRQLLSIVIAAEFVLASAAAQEAQPSTGGQTIGRLFDALGIRKPPPPAPDFVRESRPARLDYVPLAPKPDGDAKANAARLRETGASLDRSAAEARRRAARVKTPD
jgi:hypothetical protein